MELALLIDFGSTYTKATVVDLQAQTVAATAKSPTTVETNIMNGLNGALAELKPLLGGSLPVFKHRLACSSAAGGLRMVAIGLVRELTVAAAKQAALGAGARLLKVYAHELSPEEVTEIEALQPDMILLAGGTDGGNKDVLVHNGEMLAQANLTGVLVVAGNKAVTGQVVDRLQQKGKDARVCANVLPELDQLNIEPARLLIREIFFEKIVEAKGLNKAESFVGRIMMPTPAAVLAAARLLARGTDREKGLGDLMVLDIGGATTDVHSLAEGLPTKAQVTYKGLPEPYAKRTVEGDLGMRVSALSLLEAAGTGRLAQGMGLPAEAIEDYVRMVHGRTELLAGNATEWQMETGLARVAAEIAVQRHVGTLEVAWTPFGASYVQHGKDLTELPYIIGTGGVIVYHPAPGAILDGAKFKTDEPTVLRPRGPKKLLDEKYILSAIGLLAEIQPDAALQVIKKYLKAV